MHGVEPASLTDGHFSDFLLFVSGLSNEQTKQNENEDEHHNDTGRELSGVSSTNNSHSDACS